MTIRKRIVTLQTKQFVLSVDSKELCLIRTFPGLILGLRVESASSKTIITLAMGQEGRYYLTFNLIKLSVWQVFNGQSAATQVRRCLGWQKQVCSSSCSSPRSRMAKLAPGEGLDSHWPRTLLWVYTLPTSGTVGIDRDNTGVSWQAGHKLGSRLLHSNDSHSKGIRCRQMIRKKNEAWPSVKNSAAPSQCLLSS